MPGGSHIYFIVPGSHVPKPGCEDAAWEGRVNTIQSTMRKIRDAGLNNIEYEIANEPDGAQFWRWTRAQFLESWRRTVQAIRAVDPDAVIIGPNCSAQKARRSGPWSVTLPVPSGKTHWMLISALVRL